MKIDLMKFVERNEKIEELRKEALFETELNKMIASVIKGNEYFYTDDEELLEEIGLKYETNDCHYSIIYVYNDENGNRRYKVKLTKNNIRKIQKYIDEENKNE